MHRNKIILGSIVLLATIIRFVYLGNIPRGFTPDEASQGYSAYSLLETGKDEWSGDWPLTSFKSFLDYKSPLQTYLMILPVKVFGLNEFSVRFPSALFGVLSVIVVYYLANELFLYQIVYKSINIGHLASFFLAISPWHIQFSRMALEVNLASFLFPAGLYFLLASIKKPKFIFFTILFWGAALYSYHAAKFFIPLFSISAYIIFRRSFSSVDLKKTIVLTIFALLVLLPLISGILWGNDGKRSTDLLITNISGNEQSRLNDQIFYSPLTKISTSFTTLFHNKITLTLSNFTENYLSYYSLPFWFTEGGREVTYSIIPGRGLLLFWMLPLVALGLFHILSSKNKTNGFKVIIFWLLLAAIPAALTKEGYRPNRAGSFSVVWEMVGAYGFYRLLASEFRIKKFVLALFFAISLVLTGAYFEDYFLNSEVTRPETMSYGWREVVDYVAKNDNNYEKVLIEKGSQSQTFFAFYLKTSPGTFQTYAKEWEAAITKNKDVKYLDQLGSYRLGKYYFEALNWPEDKQDKVLYISPPSSLLPASRRTLHQVSRYGKVFFEIFDFPNEK